MNRRGVAIYARTSTHHHDILGQIGKVQRIAHLIGYEPELIFADHGRSRDDYGRPGWIALLNAVRTNAVHVLFVESLDRIGDGWSGVRAYTNLVDAGVRVHFSLGDNLQTVEERR